MFLDVFGHFVSNNTSRCVHLPHNLLLSRASQNCLHRALLRQAPCYLSSLCEYHKKVYIVVKSNLGSSAAKHIDNVAVLSFFFCDVAQVLVGLLVVKDVLGFSNRLCEENSRIHSVFSDGGFMRKDKHISSLNYCITYVVTLLACSLQIILDHSFKNLRLQVDRDSSQVSSLSHPLLRKH